MKKFFLALLILFLITVLAGSLTLTYFMIVSLTRWLIKQRRQKQWERKAQQETVPSGSVWPPSPDTSKG